MPELFDDFAVQEENKPTDRFANLHVHTEYSLLDGFCKINKIAQRIKELGQTAVAITDHGVMYGAIDFYRACKKEGIKPIIGCEVYVAPYGRKNTDRVHGIDSENRHLVLLCKNEEGYRNLSYMVSKAYEEGFYIKPRVDMDMLRNHSNGLIALSACLAGEIPQKILAGKIDEAKAVALEMQEIFGEGNFYLELQDHGIHEEAIANAGVIQIHNETGIPLVCSNDAHYLTTNDKEAHDILLCVQTGKTLDNPNRMRFEGNFDLKSADEMERKFPQYPDAITNTMKIVEMCNLDFTFGKYHLPEFKVPDGYTSQSYIRELCEQGFVERYKNEHPEYHKQLDYELNMIDKMGFTDYFLIVSDFVMFAKRRGIPVGPGRGSAAGSMVSYCLHITDIDPMKYSLFFERFLNPERVSMPDIDMDFGDVRRGEVIDYVKEKYGHDRVAQIVTFGTMAAKGAIRDVGRVMNIPYAEVAAVAKEIPNVVHITIDQALETSPKLKSIYDNNPQMRDLIDKARALEGTPRQASTHAAGVVITKNPVYTYVPLATNDGNLVCQYGMITLEELGLLKMDFLALRNLTILDNAIKMVQQHTPSFSMAEEMQDNDPKVFEMLTRGKTGGVFQMESAGMTGVCVDMRPTSIEDLTSIVALFRPGPMDSIPKFIESKHDPSKTTYKHPLLIPILNVTYGVTVYQEQVMQIFQQLAGYSLGQADMVRRAMGKKKVKDIERERGAFLHGDPERGIKGCVANGVPEAVAQSIYDEMYAFASYAFNKAHAVSYAVVAYQTAWFKCYYPKEYMAAVLTSVLDSTEKVSMYIGECKDMNIPLLPPDVNASQPDFTVEGNNIRFGLVAIKSIGRNVIEDLIQEREKNGLFIDFQNFCERMAKYDINKRAIENLILAGAFDCLDGHRNQLLHVYNGLIDSIHKDQKTNVEGQMDLFSFAEAEESAITAMNKIVLPNVPEMTLQERLKAERDVTGLYLSGHPMYEYHESCKRLNAVSLYALNNDFAQEGGPTQFADEQPIVVAGIITAIKQKVTKNNNMMAYVTLEDTTGSTELICFSRTLEKCGEFINEGKIVYVQGKISLRDEKTVQIICNTIAPIPREVEANRKLAGHTVKILHGDTLWIRLAKHDDLVLNYIRRLLSLYPGEKKLRIFVADTRNQMGATCSIAEPFVRELQEFLGQENVVVK